MEKKKNLVIVESPAKSKTIEKYLGSDYKVVSQLRENTVLALMLKMILNLIMWLLKANRLRLKN